MITSIDDLGPDAAFCQVDHQARSAVATPFRDSPAFFQLSLAGKSISDDSAAPILDLVVTISQNRPDSQDMVFQPKQNEYPVR